MFENLDKNGPGNRVSLKIMKIVQNYFLVRQLTFDHKNHRSDHQIEGYRSWFSIFTAGSLKPMLTTSGYLFLLDPEVATGLSLQNL